MKAFITGATGFVGSHLVDLLIENGWDVRILVRKTSNLRWIEGKNVEKFVADLRTGEDLEDAVRGVDYVFHIAGVVKGRNYDDFYEGNVKATENLLNAVVRSNENLKRFIHISSQAASRPSNSPSDFVKEEDSPCPKSFYGKSKLESEKVVLRFKSSIPITIIRPSSVFGPRDWEFLPLFRTVKRYHFAPIVGFSDRVVSLIYVKDLVRIVFLASLSNETIGKTYFACHPEPLSWKKLVMLVGNAFGIKPVKIHLPSFSLWLAGFLGDIYSKVSGKPVLLNLQKAREMMCKYWICSPDSLINTLDFNSFTSHIIAVEETAKWYVDNEWI